MYFLGQASNLRNKVSRHLFAIGNKKDSEKLKAELASRYGADSTKNVFLYHTGRTAIAAGLRAVIPKNNGEHPGIVINGLTCYAVVEAVEAAGFTPVFADIDIETLHFNGKTLEKALKKHSNVRGVILQNNLGIPCDIKSIKRVARKYDLVILEDMAHCVGVYYADGTEVGTAGVATCLSFGKSKSIDTSEGGALVIRTNEITYRTKRGGFKTMTVKLPRAPYKLPSASDRLRDRFYPFFGRLIRFFYHIKLGRLFTSFLLKIHFIKRSADAPLNLSVKLPNAQAKLALKQFQELPENRKPIREFYLVENRDKILKELEKAGYVLNDTWYECPVAPVRFYKKVNFPERECPVATEITKYIINLPTCYDRTKFKKARDIIRKYDISKEINAAIKSGEIGGKNE